MSALRVLAFLALIGVSSSQTADCSYVGLLNHLNLTTANDMLAIMRPVRNWTTVTLIQIDLLLYGILQVDEKSQTVTNHIWIQLRWKNEFLTWNSSEFCGINMLTVPISRLWIPDVVMKEDASDSGSLYKSPLASLSPNGLVFTNVRQRLTSTCQLNLFLFPFDTQSCNITFSPMNSEDDTIILGTHNNDTTLTKISELFMVTQGEWQLIKLEITNAMIKGEASRRTLIYMVTIVRKPMLYLVNLIVPLFYLLVLDLASFFICEACSEKLNFKVTVLLSISVLLLILQDMLPSTEDKLPMIASYCVAIFALVGLSVLETMLVSFLIDLDGSYGKKAQSSDDAQVDIQLEGDYHKETAAAEEEGRVKPEISHLPLVEAGGHNLLKLILEEVKAARQEAERHKEDKRTTGYYTRVAMIVDIVFFALYFLTVVIFLVCMYMIWFKTYIES